MRITKGPNDELDQTPIEDELDQTSRPVAILHFFDAAHSGRGWYYWLEEYPEEGSVGAFDFRDQAAKHAHTAGFAPVQSRGSVPMLTAAKKRGDLPAAS